MLDELREMSALLAAGNAGITGDGLLALGVIILTAVLYALALLKSGDGAHLAMRPISAYEQLKEAITAAAESGEPVHLAAGTGAVGTADTAETLAGVQGVAALLNRAAASGVTALVATPSPLVLPLLQSAAEQAYQRAGAPAEYDPARLRFAGDDRNAFAVHLTDALRREGATTSLLLGGLGDETLLIGERGHAVGVVQVIGTPSVRALPYAVATADAVVIGEEVYAAGAYLGGQSAHWASLLAQDWLRLIVVGAIVVGALVRSFG